MNFFQINEKFEKIKINFMDFLKSLGESLLKFNDLDAISN